MELADLKSHHIEGIARMGNKPFSVPLMSEIIPNLWQGGCPVGSAPKEFQFIINLYPWGKYEVHPHQVVTVAALFDSEDVPDGTLLTILASHVNACRLVGMTLVHCQAGLNRSALVSALALILSGYAPNEAIALLRRKRCDAVLCNESFERYLLGKKMLLPVRAW